ncbi:hypothetical protein RQP46_011389 [Phenoliferia psychrophenolica]
MRCVNLHITIDGVEGSTRDVRVPVSYSLLEIHFIISILCHYNPCEMVWHFQSGRIRDVTAPHGQQLNWERDNTYNLPGTYWSEDYEPMNNGKRCCRYCAGNDAFSDKPLAPAALAARIASLQVSGMDTYEAFVQESYDKAVAYAAAHPEDPEPYIGLTVADYRARRDEHDRN